MNKSFLTERQNQKSLVLIKHLTKHGLYAPDRIELLATEVVRSDIVEVVKEMKVERIPIREQVEKLSDNLLSYFQSYLECFAAYSYPNTVEDFPDNVNWIVDELYNVYIKRMQTK